MIQRLVGAESASVVVTPASCTAMVKDLWPEEQEQVQEGSAICAASRTGAASQTTRFLTSEWVSHCTPFTVGSLFPSLNYDTRPSRTEARTRANYKRSLKPRFDLQAPLRATYSIFASRSACSCV